MKGTLIVNRLDLDNNPEIEASLLQFSELMERDGDRCLFFSREGVLMTMICELLDKEIPYSLQLQDVEENAPSGRTRVKARMPNQ